jgi:hypothetical protein
MTRFAEARPYADPDAAARKLIEIACSIEPVQDGRIHIEKINWPFLRDLRGSPAEYGAGIDYAIAKGWLTMHESGTMYASRKPGQTCLDDELVPPSRNRSIGRSLTYRRISA